ncbi:AGZA family xanthine/uracil permease-like MFS transporter [Endobacter medicaginis]|jgi:adenine/guanine/hypoxanthine permease|uniref:AGZA family xanthine/uracil permease-like MFS transporter n=1 Tax=Endobacter medicaginis TaxID=1181271 RepID=A0A850NQ50_9PROT|nr:NCS2 family permease [Endobacter medicaginis]MBB3174158.1 AGZA family xanthine/uracil permease-like MFS transporter [Endobacter medicaginis]MCX5474202.1 NCS2 family permease [Endobacter medicaginis]NVN30240.1 NCS2 family permease [Endobacter medicaginis]
MQGRPRLADELVAAFTTFGAMGYVIIVNPQILSATGADRHMLIVITAMAAMIGSLLMGLIGRLPIALAPGMGSNVVFAQAALAGDGVSYGTALAMVLIGGVLFTVFSASRLRERLVAGFPDCIRIGLQGGLGLFIAAIGLRNGGLLTSAGHFGDLRQPAVLLSFAALIVTPLLMVRRIPGALLISIAAITAIGVFVPGPGGHMVTRLPSAPVQVPPWPGAYVLAFDWHEFLTHLGLALPLVGYFFLGDFFSATATLIGVTRRAGLMDAQGHLPNGRRAYLADGLASIAGACIGSPTVVAYVESATGVESGGRTGWVAVFAGLLFGASAFFWPLIAAIPPQATAPALVMVGVLMMDGLRQLEFGRLRDMVGTVLILLLTVATGNLVAGLAAGCLAWTLLALAEQLRVPAIMWLTDAMLVLYLVLSTMTSH